MTDLPRGKRPTPQERQRNIDRTGAGLGMFGGTRMAKQPPPTARGGQSRRPQQFFATRDRLTVQWTTLDIEHNLGTISDFGGYDAAFDYDGLGVQLSGDASSDNGRIYLFGEGLYCATLIVAGELLSGASSSETLGANLDILDRPDGEDFSAVSRGGDPSGAIDVSTSTTFYSEGHGFTPLGGGIGVSVSGQNLVNADVGRVWVTVIVQKIIGFGA